MKTTIYSLRDPRTGAVRYIGRTKNASQREVSYRSGKPHSKRLSAWFADLAASGLSPEFVREFEVSREKGAKAERKAVRLLIRNGADLLNSITFKRKRAKIAVDAEWPPERIAALRQRLRFTQKEFADRLGYKRSSSVSEIETGGRVPGKSTRIVLRVIDDCDGLPLEGFDPVPDWLLSAPVAYWNRPDFTPGASA